MTTDAEAAAHTTVTGPSVWERRTLLAATVMVVTGVAGIAAAISYGHMHDWASANGEPSWRALLFPLSVDGLLIAASAVLLADSRSGRKADWLAWTLVVVGSLVSVTANVAHDWVARAAEIAIAGWPPLALVGSYELLMRLLRRLQAPADTEVTVPAVESPAELGGPAERDEPSSASSTPTEPRPRKRAASKPRSGAKSRPSREPEARQWWERERAEGREPSGAEVARAVGVDGSLGRRWMREWQAAARPAEVTGETDNDVTVMDEATGRAA
ncbi:uncharacterized protein DUF2637 [Kribbella orskensis]|uniref:Uncharacterized protein DUF2637 n=1 Tax=Kribbella orskensis TaxID=2512216 RepID=A0ABY2BQS2_9ACTN|nr:MULTISPECIES: DUF2637 domain-containing protein [Kribbella]TCN28171.1 uncharacterized protein DUF2637 [Kribbella sp. VKM Ac-2500]TCO27967.1 uncharacterized protein DUF2637 [Kribbella orskensis]